MKKMIGMIALLLLMMGVVGCNRETVNINFPFEMLSTFTESSNVTVICVS